MEVPLTVNTHKSVGPYKDLYGHGPVIFIQEKEGEGQSMDITESLFTCLDCGWTDSDVTTFAHEECNREDNRVNSTVRERVGEGEMF